MLEIGEYAPEAHKIIGRKAAKIADIIFCVGARSKFLSEAARKNGCNNVFEFDDSDQARLVVQETIQENDIVLIKGSRGMKMEKIVKEIMAEPERAKELLV